jgi:hypothetical protein
MSLSRHLRAVLGAALVPVATFAVAGTLATPSRASALTAVAPTPSRGPVGYRVIDLGALGTTGSQAIAVNGRGQVALVSGDRDGVDHALVWTPGVGLRDLGPGRPVAINGRGEVAGVRDDRAVRWDASGAVTVLDGPGSRPYAMNSAGLVVGRYNSGARLWRPGQPAITPPGLGDPRFWISAAVGVNDLGVVVGLWQPAIHDGGQWWAGFRWDARRGTTPWVLDDGTNVPLAGPDEGGMLGLTANGWSAGNEDQGWTSGQPSRGRGVWVVDPGGRVQRLDTLGGMSARADAAQSDRSLGVDR